MSQTVEWFEFIRCNVNQTKKPFTATEQHIINIIKENPNLWQEAIAQTVAEIPVPDQISWSDKSPDTVQNEPFPTSLDTLKLSVIPSFQHSVH